MKSKKMGYKCLEGEGENIEIMVSIPRSEYESLKKTEEFLRDLCSAGLMDKVIGRLLDIANKEWLK